MKKVLMMVATALFATALVGCGDYFSSPERKAFEQFVAHCKAQPSAADCKAWEESKRSPGG